MNVPISKLNVKSVRCQGFGPDSSQKLRTLSEIMAIYLSYHLVVSRIQLNLKQAQSLLHKFLLSGDEADILHAMLLPSCSK